MLGRRLSRLQWFSLILLTIGVSSAELSSSYGSSEQEKSNTIAGFIAVLSAACTSGFSGVYFEKILKSSGSTLWVRNLQMGISSIILAFFGIYFSGELPLVLELGYFHGYNWIVMTTILLQAIGGLVVAVVVKYADNILKGFAAAFSMLTSSILCFFFFDFHPNIYFFFGLLLVNLATYLYSYTPNKEVKRDEDDQ